MSTRLRYRSHPTPVVWHKLTCQWWGMNVDASRRLWRALRQATWSRAVGLRSQILLLESDPIHEDVVHFINTTIAPPVVVQVLEDLAREGVLPEKEVWQFIDIVLGLTNEKGHWI